MDPIFYKIDLLGKLMEGKKVSPRNDPFELQIGKDRVNILKEEFDQRRVDDLCGLYGELVSRELIKCEINNNLIQLRNKLLNTKWLVVSGGNQNELRHVFESRGIKQFFQKGIFPSILVS